MEKNLDFRHSDGDFDITKYILIVVKKYKFILFVGTIFLILNLVYNSYKDEIVKSSLIVGEKKTIQFLLMPNIYNTLQNIGFSTQVILELHKGNFF